MYVSDGQIEIYGVLQTHLQTGVFALLANGFAVGIEAFVIHFQLFGVEVVRLDYYA